ncbi:MAG: cytochrome C [Actinomycetes bacterium]
MSRWARSPIFYGIAAAALAGAVGQWGKMSPPTAYGLCSACHGRDLADWFLNHVEGAKLYVASPGGSWPILTVVGLVLGSFLASRRNGEFGSINLGGNVRQFVFGALAMGAALFVGGCPTRIIIRTGYGDVAAVLALMGVATGIVVATLSMRWAARR